MSEESWRTRGGSTTNNNNTGNNDNSWVRRAGDEGGNWRGGRSDNNVSSSSRSERPKLNLTKRGEAADTPNAIVDADDAEEEKKAESTAAAGEQRPNRQRNSERRFREPEVVNSRAAMLGEVAAPRKEVSDEYYDVFMNNNMRCVHDLRV